MSDRLSRDLIFILFQFMKENNFDEAIHRLERDSKLFFDINYMKELIAQGEFKQVEYYFSGFIKINENEFSTKTFFEIRKQNYMEALDKNDRNKAFDILINDLKPIETLDQDSYKKMANLLTVDNNRFSNYPPTMSAARAMLSRELEKLICLNPLLKDKLKLPEIAPGRLRTLINQSFNWQHSRCQNPKEDPLVTTLLQDHDCGASNADVGGPSNPSPTGNNVGGYDGTYGM